MNKKQAAYHEAGHAAIGRVLTLPCGPASIKPDYKSGTAGVSVCPDPYECISEWEKRGKSRSLSTVWIARIIHSMAGAEAAAELLGAKQHGDNDDRYQIALMMEELAPANWERCEARLRRMTRMLIRRHKQRIDRVAEALLAKTSLSTRALDNLVGRSVRHVKVNAPFLLRRKLTQQESDLLSRQIESFRALNRVE
jgi:hypothetical protein